MQEFATGKASAWGGTLNQLICLFKDRYAVRVMKLTSILLLSACLHVAANGISQTVTLSFKDAPIEKVFKAIKQQTHFVFFSSYELLQKAKKVTIDVKNMPLKEVLDLCFKDQPFTYVISENIITVMPKKNETPVIKQAGVLGDGINVHGKVVDEIGKPVAGVTVTVKGTKMQTITDENGEFNIPGVEANAILAFSTVNMQPFEVRVDGKTEIIAKLKTKTSELDEVQIIAYGQTTKRLNTGNVATIKTADIEKQPVTNPLLALQGRVAGLVITQNTGVPGGGVTVRIQGVNSIFNGNDPLIIIDGVPYPSQMLPTTTGGRGASASGTILGTSGGTKGEGGNPLNYINPADIESIDVLKDADATAIYGSRAANGAILITTKKGKSGKMKVDLNLQQGWGKVAKHVDMLNTQQYLMMRREAFNKDGLALPAYNPNATSNFDLTIWDSTRYTDWQKKLIGGTAQVGNVNLGVSGGTDNVQYRIGGTYNRTTTVFPINKPTNNASVDFNINTVSVNKKFHLQLGGNYLFSNVSLPLNDITYQALTLAPNSPYLYNEDGSLNWEPNAAGSSTWTNPLSLQQSIYENKTYNLISNSTLSYLISPGLEIKSSFGYNQIQTTEFYGLLLGAFPPEAIPFVPPARNAANTNSRIFSWIMEPQISYHRNIGKGNVELLVGSSIQEKKNNGEQITGTGYSSDQVLRDFRSATRLSINTLYSEYKYAAIFGRLNYNWANKYLINFTMRRDGSSRFGPENRFHNFGAVGLGWIFSGEKFIANNIPWLSFGKIKGSFGTTGSDQIGDYSFLNLYSSFATSVLPYQGLVGITGGIFNPYLQWEETKKIQGGAELGFLNDRILISALYACNRSSNQLLNYELPIMTGVGAIYSNFPATVENTSYEFTLNTVNVKNKNYTWGSSFNLTIPHNKLVKFVNLQSSAFANTLIIGEPLGTYKTYAYAGVDESTGLYQVYDKSGNPTSRPSYPSDLTSVIENGAIKFYGGLENKIQYKNISLDFLFQFAQQVGGLLTFSDPGSFQRGGGKSTNHGFAPLAKNR